MIQINAFISTYLYQAPPSSDAQAYILLCIDHAANKLVFYKFHFQFVTTLTLIHTIFTFLGMVILSRVGFFEVKPLMSRDVLPLAITYVGYVVLGNASLNLNSVALYQILKIAGESLVSSIVNLDGMRTRGVFFLISW